MTPSVPFAERWKIIMEYQCIMQHDITDCGAACIATICKQNGYKISITRIREVSAK